MVWDKGRQLKSTWNKNQTVHVAYTYNANGIRTSKTINGMVYTYTLDGTKILREDRGSSDILIPLYDNEDSVCGLTLDGTPYYFQKNLQGDVIAITDANGDIVARYSYDAWGKCTVTLDTSGINISNRNPYRYRGYYYDSEIDMYYLQSRYYDPETGRFINADAPKLLGIGGTIAGYNLLAYCESDPVNNGDTLGLGPWTPILTLSDYRAIHNKVADSVAFAIGVLRAQREVYVTGPRGRGFLDVYDIVSNEYYEVKSSGAAYKSSTDRQMKKYDIAKPPASSRGCVKRGGKKVSGSFYYGAWHVTYKLEKKGLVVYYPKWKRERLSAAAVTLIAIIVITIAAFATGGATIPAYGLLLI